MSKITMHQIECIDCGDTVYSEDNKPCRCRDCYCCKLEEDLFNAIELLNTPHSEFDDLEFLTWYGSVQKFINQAHIKEFWSARANLSPRQKGATKDE